MKSVNDLRATATLNLTGTLVSESLMQRTLNISFVTIRPEDLFLPNCPKIFDNKIAAPNLLFGDRLSKSSFKLDTESLWLCRGATAFDLDLFLFDLPTILVFNNRAQKQHSPRESVLARYSPPRIFSFPDQLNIYIHLHPPLNNPT